MRPLTLLFGASLLLPATASAEEVAAILLMQGEVTLSDGTTADVGVGLERDDTIYVGEESAAVLHLHNDWLVRVDEDLELAVSDIVLLDAPRAERSIDDQLDDLLYPDERESMPGIDRAERVAGWHARLTAAQAPPSLDYEADDLVAPSSSFAPSPAPPPPAPAPGASAVVEELARAVETRRTRGSRKSKRAKSDDAPMAAAPAPQPELKTEDAKPQAPATDLQALVQSGDGLTCLQEWLGTLPIDIYELRFTLVAQDGVVHRVILDQGLTAPPCLREVLVGEPMSQDRVSFTIPLAE